MSLLEKFDAFVEENEIDPGKLIREVLIRAKNRAFSLYHLKFETKNFSHKDDIFKFSDYPRSISVGDYYGEGVCFEIGIDYPTAFGRLEPNYEHNKQKIKELEEQTKKEIEERSLKHALETLKGKGYLKEEFDK